MGSPLVIPDAPGAAIIGGGFIGAGARRGAAADRRRGRGAARVFARARLGRGPPAGDPRVYRDLDEVLADDRVGVVHIASPNSSHFDQARRTLESGRHVVCEKPLAEHVGGDRGPAALAESRPDQAAAVNYNIRYYPLCREVRERIAAGALGAS